MEELSPDLVSQVFMAGEQGQWVLMAGLLLTVLIWVVRRFTAFKRVPGKYVPFVAAVVGVLSDIAASMINGRSWDESIIQGFLVGTSAMGFWSLLGKFALPLPDKLEDNEGK